MKLPICVFDAKSGLLCQDCQSRLEKGEISSVEVEISKAIVKLEERFPALKDATVREAVDIGPFIVMKVEEKDLANIIGPRGKVISEIEQAVRKNIRVIEATTDVRKLIESLLAGAEILGINRVFVPDGTEELKVRVRSSNKSKLPASKEVLRDVIHKLSGELIRITFE